MKTFLISLLIFTAFIAWLFVGGLIDKFYGKEYTLMYVILSVIYGLIVSVVSEYRAL